MTISSDLVKAVFRVDKQNTSKPEDNKYGSSLQMSKAPSFHINERRTDYITPIQ
jgi:hypothetical protein